MNAEKFWANAVPEPNTGCLLWLGATCKGGYGLVQLSGKGRVHMTHRIAFELHYGPIPEGLLVCHRCDTPACMNPDHLFLGSHSDNQNDALRKGRAKPLSPHNSGNQQQTHCKVGHEMNGENVLNTRTKGRRCRACFRARQKEYAARKRARAA